MSPVQPESAGQQTVHDAEEAALQMNATPLGVGTGPGWIAMPHTTARLPSASVTRSSRLGVSTKLLRTVAISSAHVSYRTYDPPHVLPNGSRLSCGRLARRRKAGGRQSAPARAQTLRFP